MEELTLEEKQVLVRMLKDSLKFISMAFSLPDFDKSVMYSASLTEKNAVEKLISILEA